MKVLVVCYSRTGNTRKVAKQIAAAIGCDVEEIVETVKRDGMRGYLLAGRDAMRKAVTPIQPVSKDISGYDLVVVGTPVWAFTMASPIRTFLTEHSRNIRRVAFFCTMGGSGAERSFGHMEEICGKPPVATLALTEREAARGSDDKIRAFVTALT